jgi:hypothetical protein
MENVDPLLGDSTRGLLEDLVVHDIGAGASRSAAPAPGSLSIVSLGISWLHLSGSPGSSSPPIDWRRVEDEAEFLCSQVAVTEKLLHETLASVHWNILHLVQVSLKRETKFCPFSNDFLHAFSFFLCCVPTTFISG